jgi:hypothetical protein
MKSLRNFKEADIGRLVAQPVKRRKLFSERDGESQKLLQDPSVCSVDELTAASVS